MERNVTSVLHKTRQSGKASSSGDGRRVSDCGGGDNGGGRNGGRRKDDGGDEDDGEGADVRGSNDSGGGGACGYSYSVELEAGRMMVQVRGRRHTVLVVEKDMLMEAELELIVDVLLECWQGREM